MADFLDEIWGGERLFVDTKRQIVADEEILAVILCVNPQNFDSFMALAQFRAILTRLSLRADIFSVQTAQIGAINALINAKISRAKIEQTLNLLADERILTQTEHKILLNFINRIKEATLEQEQTKNGVKKDFFHERTDALNAIYERLLTLTEDQSHTNRLKNSYKKINELKFNLAVTGVINSGKSTLLNALLDKQILGTSNIPETANLTILTFADAPQAVVNFWSERELKELGIKTSSEALKFAGGQIRVDINDIKSYTSAKFELSKLAKSIVLYENLALLQDGVQIVDTPGIDDAVFLRERLACDYMSECDLMLHLMNAAQSATQKDMEFITRSIKNSHISRLVVVLTHADLLSQRELAEVATYTKKSVASQLKEAGLESIADELKLFCVSSHEYFKNPKNGGVSELKEFLYDTLFGPRNEKSRLATLSYERELCAVSSELLEQAKLAILNLSGSNLELNDKILALKEGRKTLQEKIALIEQTTKNELNKIDSDSLNASFLMEIKNLIAAIKNRLLNEAKYLQKNGKKLEAKQAHYIIGTALYDGILSATRLKRNEILSQIASCAQNLALLLDDFKLDISEQNKIFNIGEYLASQGVELEYKSVSDSVAPYLDSPRELEAALDAALRGFLEDERLRNFILNLVDFEKDKFKNLVESELKNRQDKILLDERNLSEQMQILSKHGENLAQNLAKLNDKKAAFERILEELKC